ncbi:MAG: M28 family peptidase [Acidobacteriota bacterium]
MKASVYLLFLSLQMSPAIARAGQIEGSAARLTGFSHRSTMRQKELEARLKALLSPRRVEEHLRWLTRRPHRTGSEEARLTAEYLHQRLKAWGFETETVRYDAFLPAPVSVFVELVEPIEEGIPTVEDRIAEDPFTQDVGDHPGWNGYSASGEVTAQVVYAHRGSETDLRTLETLGVDLRGKILLMRYFGTGEGRKVHNAEQFGAAGVVLYADPAEDGYRYGDVYPEGNWRPPGSIMRRSVEFLPYSGDPLSPGWASVPGARQLRPEDVALPRIPVLPISYRSAQRILQHLGGPVAPRTWQGALSLTYKVGPGPAKLHIRTEMDNRDRPMWNVIGRLEGEFYPDEWVLVGNHHDAWIYGAGDPSSGTASLLELARSVGRMAQAGFRPRRTFIVAFWDAEEMLLGGSTEWVEEHSGELLEKAVAYINMDSSVFNTHRPLSVSAHTALHPLFRAVARDISDPRTRRSLFDTWRDLQNRCRRVPSVDGWGEFFDPERELSEPWLFETPYDDAAPFYQYLALPASDMYYGADYGMYHSIYENFHWMKTVVDPAFDYHILMSQVQGFVALRLANADLLALDYVNEARYWRMAYRDLERIAKGRGQEVPRLADALELIDLWEAEAGGFQQAAAELLQDEARMRRAAPRLARINRGIYLGARDFLRPEGQSTSFARRNLFAGSSHDFEGVSGSTLPGIRFALDQGKLDKATREADLYLEALRRRVGTLETLRREIQSIE